MQTTNRPKLSTISVFQATGPLLVSMNRQACGSLSVGSGYAEVDVKRSVSSIRVDWHLISVSKQPDHTTYFDFTTVLIRAS